MNRGGTGPGYRREAVGGVALRSPGPSPPPPFRTVLPGLPVCDGKEKGVYVGSLLLLFLQNTVEMYVVVLQVEGDASFGPAIGACVPVTRQRPGGLPWTLPPSRFAAHKLW